MTSTLIERTLPGQTLWHWCDSCECWYIKCPKCGNNACNGMYGTVDGQECDLCPAAYAAQDAFDKLEDFPNVN